jgi:drug/metabolite transporter (DMT)-like permease
MLPAFLTTILFSVSAVCANRTIRFMGSTEANFWRFPVAIILLALYAHIFGAGLSGGAFHIFFLSGLVGFGFGDLALFQALPRLGSRLTVLMVHCLASPLAAVIEWRWLGTTLTRSEILAAVTILIGVFIALAPREGPQLERKKMFSGLLFGLVAAFGQGFGAVLSRRGFQAARLNGEKIDGITAAYQRIIGGMIVAGIALLFVKQDRFWKGKTRFEAEGSTLLKWRSSWHWIGLNALAGPVLGVSCYQWALKMKGSGLVLPIVAITPLVIIPFSRRMEGETPGLRSLFGSLIAVIGAIALACVS